MFLYIVNIPAIFPQLMKDKILEQSRKEKHRCEWSALLQMPGIFFQSHFDVTNASYKAVINKILRIAKTCTEFHIFYGPFHIYA